jgi:hypothetical protein
MEEYIFWGNSSRKNKRDTRQKLNRIQLLVLTPIGNALSLKQRSARAERAPEYKFTLRKEIKLNFNRSL